MPGTPQSPVEAALVPTPPGPVLTGVRNSQCGVAKAGGVREPDPAGRRGRGGGPGAWGGAGARLPPPFIQPTVGAEGLGRPARHWERERAGPGLRGTPCAPATMSDPAVNAQLDGIISDFEGGCPTPLGERGRSPQAGLGRDRGEHRRGKTRDCSFTLGLCVSDAVLPTWRAPLRDPVANRPCSWEPRTPWGPEVHIASGVFFLLLLFVFAQRLSPPQGLA